MTADPVLRIADALGGPGWGVFPGFLPMPEVRALAEEARRRVADFHAAAIGRGADRRERPDIRGDRILWLEPPGRHPAEARFLARLEALRLGLNRELTLGLFDAETHYAVYPPGASYARHVDQPAGSSLRKVSLTCYLNEGWSANDGGALRLYLSEERNEYVDVLPESGVAAAFLSDRFPHEVLPPRRERASLTTWFRARP